MSAKSTQSASDLTESQVVKFLKSNPGLIERHPELLALHHANDGPVVDFKAALIEKLRGQVTDLKGNLVELVRTGKATTLTLQRVERAVMALLQARNSDELAEVIANKLPATLNVDAVSLCLEGLDGPLSRERITGIYRTTAGSIEQVMGNCEILLSPIVGDEGRIFGDIAHEIQSCVVMRLPMTADGVTGLIGFGSQKLGTFSPEQGTDLVQFLVRIVAREIDRNLARRSETLSMNGGRFAVQVA